MNQTGVLFKAFSRRIYICNFLYCSIKINADIFLFSWPAPLMFAFCLHKNKLSMLNLKEVGWMDIFKNDDVGKQMISWIDGI